MKTKLSIKSWILILIMAVSLGYCHRSNEGGYQGTPPTHIKIDESKTANVSFSLVKKVEVTDCAAPRISVSNDEDTVIFYGDSIKKNEKSKFIVKTYNKNLGFKGEKAFDYGAGPIDVGAANIISIANGKRYVSQNSNRRVCIYDNEWRLESCIRLGNKIRGVDAFELYNHATFAVLRFVDDIRENLIINEFQIVSFPGFEQKTLFKSDPYSDRVVRGGNGLYVIGGNEVYSWFYRNKEIYILACYPYRIFKFDMNGKKLKDIIVDVERIKTDHSLDEKYLLEFGLRTKNRYTFEDTVSPTALMIPFSKGFVVVRRYDYSSESEDWSEGDYFSENLEYMGKIKVPPSYKLLSFRLARNNERLKYQDGYVYQIQEKDETFFIEKWKVTE